jgi:phosphoribosylglycinamide formyltransferase-1
VTGSPEASRRKRVAVLASGRGSNLQSLLDACAAADFPATIALVIVNVPEAQALERARKAGVPALLIDHRIFPSRVAFDTAIDLALRAAATDLVCLAGFMRRLTPEFTLSWAGRLINIHPSLLPAFPGMHTHRRALEAGASTHGCSVHFVTAELDAGPVIAQAAVPVLPGDDEERLAARVLVAEHALYPAALRLVAEGAVRMEGDRMTAAD